MRVLNITDINIENICFEEAKFNQKKDNDGFDYYRIMVNYEFDDGSIGPLLIVLPKDRYSFGVGTYKGYENKPDPPLSVSLVLYNDPLNPTEEEKMVVDKFEEITDYIRDYLLQDEVKESIEREDLIEPLLRNLTPIFRKKVRNQVVPDKSPVLYPRLIINKKKNVFITKIFDPKLRTEYSLPGDLWRKHGHCTAVVKFESIFVNTKDVCIQLKLQEAHFTLKEGGVGGGNSKLLAFDDE